MCFQLSFLRPLCGCEVMPREVLYLRYLLLKVLYGEWPFLGGGAASRRFLNVWTLEGTLSSVCESRAFFSFLPPKVGHSGGVFLLGAECERGSLIVKRD